MVSLPLPRLKEGNYLIQNMDSLTVVFTVAAVIGGVAVLVLVYWGVRRLYRAYRPWMGWLGLAVAVVGTVPWGWTMAGGALATAWSALRALLRLPGVIRNNHF